ncbi:uncharacterized protein BDZ99DRAFT_484717 [Mytilinidion resinicola]|uniref:RTA1-domain-containing protein n=1 Tax=Mytilinidion resinicola TaxID=574789 RepID=A0A6A6Z499_9PEZI|nr:uncharacterized protein BDZ99DRAFT_484717 [Mytilinidion resinicola]KAF2815906.1 hypothetical protein BDZ99DRAFT_484717 [Mytilinidion resinicola]
MASTTLAMIVVRATPSTTLPALPSAFKTATATASCTTAIPGKHGFVSDPMACNAYWSYNPSFAAAILFSVLFGLLLFTHIAEAFIYKKTYTWVLLMGVAWEFVSFCTRAASTLNQQNLTLVIVSQILLLLAPLWINAFAYMTLGRLIHFFHPARRIWRIPGASVAKYFVWADVVSFLIQGTGGSMLSPGSDASTQKLGIDVYMAGVGVQEGFILLFVLLAATFQREMGRVERSGAGVAAGRGGWRGAVGTLYAVLVLISIRIIYRLVEYSRGSNPNNPLPFHEAYVYALDATPMMLAVLVLAVGHPGRVLVGPESHFPSLSRKEKRAAKRAKKAEKAERKAGRREGKRGVQLEEGVFRR